jgi:hypothetical protein
VRGSEAAGLRAGTGLAGIPGNAPSGAPRQRTTRRVAWAALTVVVAVGLFGAYLLQSRTIPAGPDGSSIALQAWDMLHGDPLLRGWWVADVTFYTTEIPQYMLIEWVHGLSPGDIHIGGAMTYTLLVLLAAFLARGRARGRAGIVRAVLAGGVMLAPSLGDVNPTLAPLFGDATQTLVLSPDHTGTAVPVLLILLLVDLARPRWYVPVLVGLVLAWVLIADILVVFIGTVPLALVCGLRVYQGVVVHREGLRSRWYELSLAVAAIISVPAGLAGIALIKAAGGWQLSSPQTKLATVGMLGRNLRLTGKGTLELFGADFFDAGSARGVVFALIHLVGMALVVWGFCAAVRRFPRRDGMVESVLAVAIVVNLAAYASGVQAVDMLSTREIARPGFALAAVLACYAGMLGFGAAQPAPPAAYSDLTAWLSAHHLRYGLSGYTQANTVTVQSRGAVSLRPVGPYGRFIAARKWEGNSSWYAPSSYQANFVALSSVGAAEVTSREVVDTFGRPARTYRYRDYTIMIWNYNLLTRLR